MPYLDTPQKAAEWLSEIKFEIKSTEPGDFTPDHMKYNCLLSWHGKEYAMSYQSNPAYYGEPTVVDVVTALTGDALSIQGMSMGEFLDEMSFEPPSAGVRAYQACQKSYDWFRDAVNGLGFSFDGLVKFSEVLVDDQDEISEAVAKLQEQKAEKEAFEHPEVPEGWRTIDDLCGELDLGDFGEECFDCTYDDVSDNFSEVADSNIDIYTQDLLEWLPENYQWVAEAYANGILEGCHGDIPKMIAAAQYECFQNDLYKHREDIQVHSALRGLEEQGVYALSGEVAESIIETLNGNEYDRFSYGFDDAETVIADAMQEKLEEAFGDETAASIAYDAFAADHDSQCVNPVAMSKEAVRLVNEKGYDAAFKDCWANVIDTLEETHAEEKSFCIESASKDCRSESAKSAGEHAVEPDREPPSNGGHDEH